MADFDAVASLLGAALLDEAAVAVLPRRVNRNVRAYLTLYGPDLALRAADDLPPGKPSHITVVDTQTRPTLKGVTAKTPVRVIDHHDRQPDLPAEWETTIEPLGACTTLLVEGLQALDVLITVPQATLLLLGIYEDTGGLTYTRTTARDARAVAALLEQGASLQVAQGFLNQPLTAAQQAIYEQLRQSAEIRTVHGQQIILATADASQGEEELSSLAHKLNDLLEPDGLVLAIQTGGGVQLIARSTTDAVRMDVLMADFGGGGHRRAAAAMLPDAELAAVVADLLERLPRHVLPAITVGELMSRQPQALEADAPARDAAELMQRYGYEGFPVVAGGKVVGLLTRRAVDRALTHGLKVKVRELMSTGGTTLQPADSIEQLQQAMLESGWGQIPVVSPETGELVGIVTRTDLLKTLMPQTGPRRPNRADQLAASLPPARLALLRAAAAAAQQRGEALYIVGGFVRDLLLERPSPDLDLVVEGDAIALAEALAKQYGGKVTSHRRFGTAKWLLDSARQKVAAGLATEADPALNPEDLPASLDLVSARREFYTHPTALPTVERGSIKLDLHRRDFTINTLALRLDGRYFGDLLDYWGGLQDLDDGIVRVLHSLSFVDDPTRMLRAARFEGRFGFEIGPRTLELLGNALPLLERVSGDRLRHELNAILGETDWAAILQRLAGLKVLATIHPALGFDAAAAERLELARHTPPGPEWGLPDDFESVSQPLALAYTAWFLTLEGVQAASLAGRLRLTAPVTKAILAACSLRPELAALVGAAPSRATARLDEAPPLALAALYLTSTDGRVRELLEIYTRRWRHIHPQTDGHDLRARGVPAGPRYRQLLTALREAWLDGTVKNADEEHDLLEKLLHDG